MLSKDLLQGSLRQFFSPSTMPRGSVAEVVSQWASSYIKYASFAVAGGTILVSPLQAIPVGGAFFNAIDQSFRSLWMSAVWAAPGMVGKTFFVPSLVPLLQKNAGELISSRDPDRALTLIVESLHSYTLGITVSVVGPSGTPVIVPIV